MLRIFWIVCVARKCGSWTSALVEARCVVPRRFQSSADDPAPAHHCGYTKKNMSMNYNENPCGKGTIRPCT